MEGERDEHEKNNEKASWGGVALVLSLTMALGIFAGTGMDVKAADEYYFEKITLDKSNDVSITIMIGTLGKWPTDNETIQAIQALLDKQPKESLYILWEGTYSYKNSEGKPVQGTLYKYRIDNKGWSEKAYNDLPGTWYIIKKRSASSTSGSGSDTSLPSHTHSYSWVTVQDVSSEQDGIEEYRCSCGDVQERCVIPRYMAIVKGLCGAVKDAPQNGTATFDSGRLYTISDYVIKKLAERTNVTTVITFEYQNQAYKMTIPAGADFTGLLADEEYFYGYFFFANAVGAKIEAI